MRVVIQRVDHASVKVEDRTTGKIEKGLLILVGFEDADDTTDLEWMSNKVANLRIFPDENGLMNLSVHDIEGKILVVSQFTLHANTKKGNRPSFIRAAKPEIAVPLYEQFIEMLGEKTKQKIRTGEFGALMQVVLLNSGPVTIIIDSKNKE